MVLKVALSPGQMVCEVKGVVLNKFTVSIAALVTLPHAPLTITL